MRAPPNSIGISLAAPNGNLRSPVIQKFKVCNLEGCQLRPPGQNVISNVEECPVPEAEEVLRLEIDDLA